VSQRLKWLLKIALSGLILWLVATRIDWPELWGVLRAVRYPVLGLSFLALFVQQFLMVVTWRLVIRQMSGEVSLGAVLYSHLVGNFYGTLLPSTLGIDVIRALSLQKFGARVADAAATLVTTRAIGFSALFFLAGWAYFFPASREMALRFAPALLLSFGVFLCCLAAVAWPHFLSPVEAAFRKLEAERLARIVADVRRAFSLSFRSGEGIALVFALSVVYQFLGVFVAYLLGVSVGASATIDAFLFVVPAVTILTAIPISVAGLGVREGSFVVLLGQVGVPAESALSISLLFFLQALFLAFLGGAVHWAVSLGRTKPAVPQ